MDKKNIAEKIRNEAAKLIEKASGQDYDAGLMTTPPKPELGDLAAPMFSLSKGLGKDPVSIANDITPSMTSDYFSEVRAVGPYVNFFINSSLLAGEVLSDINKDIKKYGQNTAHKGEKVMIEYFSPNTNKPLTVGHLRNIVLGSTISRLYTQSSAKVIQACLYNDRGIAIAKSMVAYDLFGEGATPESEGIKPDQFVGKFYVMFGRKAEEDLSLDEKAREYLQLWEEGDKEIRALWKKMNGWVYEGFAQTLEKLNEGKFDKIYYESEFYDKAKELVLENVGKGVIKKGDEGEIYAELEPEMPNKILLRSDGTSLYITQDIVLASMKEKEKINSSIYITGDEQNLQIKQLFAILESMGESETKHSHLSYGMMRLPEGKIKSREGFGRALADALIEQLEELASGEVKERQPDLSEKEVAENANQIMNAALKFYILNIDPKKTMIFDPEQAVSFTGKTGPYLQYTAVRLRSILREEKAPKKPDYSLLSHDLEKRLLNMLKDYPQKIEEALEQYSPSILTHYLYELAQLSNTYYHDVPVLKADKDVRGSRLTLISAVIEILTDGLGICGIEVPQKM